jgi:hypothetical protein
MAGLVAFLAANGTATVRALRILSGIAIVGAAGTHAAHWWGQPIDPTAWWVDAAAMLVALIIAVPALRRRSAPAAGLTQQPSAAPAE